jgi:Lon protease-like protein
VGNPLPMFPLGTVLFPGVSLPLHVFEDRYRAMVKDLLTEPDPGRRRLGIVAIREGYEVGSHGMQSAHRIGCEAQLLATREHPDGRYDIVVGGRRRLLLEEVDTSGDYLLGRISYLEEERGDGAPEATRQALSAFALWQGALASTGVELGADADPAESVGDPLSLSYALCSAVSLTLRERQQLLEADDAATRLTMLASMLRDEMHAIRAVPSLPATELSRTAWSPN